jgi:hypothetical protein
MEIEEIIKFYEYFYKKLSGDFNYIYRLSKKDKIIIENFLKLFEKNGVKKESLGKEFWFNYFSFQFEYWRTKYTYLGKNKVLLSWIIGIEAYKRWINKSKNWKWFSDNNLIKLFNINKSDLIPKNQNKKNFEIDRQNQENLKKQFEQKGENKLGLCLLYTDLFYNSSKICLSCKDKIDCEKIKKEIYV